MKIKSDKTIKLITSKGEFEYEEIHLDGPCKVYLKDGKLEIETITGTCAFCKHIKIDI